MSNRKYKEWAWAYFMIAPTIIGLFFLNIWPILQTVWLSLSRDLGFGKYKFIGIGNYVKMFENERTWMGLQNTLVFALTSVPIGIFLALILASMMSNKIRGVQTYRVLYFLPMIAAPAAVTMVWRFIYNNDFGLLNQALSLLKIDGPAWISDPKTAMSAIVVIAIWGGLGQQIIILIASITGVNPTYYEAASIDGASPVRKFVSITIPMVTPSIFFLAITGIIGALRQFDIVYMMYFNTTNPATNSVRTLMYEYYNRAFVANDRGYASALVMFAFAVIMIFTAIQFIAQKKWVNYD